MIANLLSGLLGLSSSDLVAIFDDESFEEVFTPASPMRVSARRENKITRFPVEDGGLRTDHVVTELAEVTLDFMLTEDTKNAYARFREAFLGKRLLTVQTKVESFPSMMIEALPHEESAELGSSILVPIRFVEWAPIVPEMGESTADKKQSKTVNRGQQQTTEAPPATNSKGSILGGWYRKL